MANVFTPCAIMKFFDVGLIPPGSWREFTTAGASVTVL